MKRLFFLLIFGLSLVAPFTGMAGVKNLPKPPDQPEIVVALQRIFAGTTLHPADARPVSITLAPLRAAFHIAF